MSLERSDVEKIAHLARLAISEDECGRYAPELSKILDLVAEMDAVDTSDVTPMAHPLHMAQRLRPDTPTETDRRAELQSTAPLTESGLYLVPRVIE